MKGTGDYISREAPKEYIEREEAEKRLFQRAEIANSAYIDQTPCQIMMLAQNVVHLIPAADVRPVPEGGIGEMSDGYHTFNGLYYQRMVLFATLVKAHKDKAWKSRKHEDGEPCFGGGWFIVGIDTPQGSYTYHYEDKYWNWFECEELPVAKHWDGHTEEDVTRLLSLNVRPMVRSEWKIYHKTNIAVCKCCSYQYMMGAPWHEYPPRFCPNCGAMMEES